MTDLEVMTPRSLDHVVKRCLAKDPDERWQTASDVMREVKWVTESGSEETPIMVGQAKTQSRLPWAVAAILTLALATTAWFSLVTPPSPQSSPVRRYALNLLTDDGSPLVLPDNRLAVDPGGRILAVRGTGPAGPQLFVRRIDSTEIVPITGTQGIESVPAISPDAAWVAFSDGQQLRMVSLAGGAAVSLHPLPENPFGITWAGTDNILFGGPEGISRITAAGGTPELITRVDAQAGEVDHRWPWVTPDGNILAYTVWGGTNSTSPVRLHVLQTGAERTLMVGGSPRVTPTGHLIFARRGTLWAAPINRETLETLAPAVPFLEGINFSTFGYNAFDLTNDGTLVYSQRLDRAVPPELLGGDGTLLAKVGEAFQGVHHGPPLLSPDGRFLAVGRHLVGGRDEIVIRDLDRGTFTPLDTSESSRFQVWTPGGTRLTFSSNREGTFDIFEVDTAGTVAPEPLLIREGDQVPLSWSPNGDVLAFRDGSAGAGDIWLLPRDGEPSLLLGNPTADESDAAFSPDGRFLAFVSDESGRPEVWVEDYPNGGRPIRVSTDGGENPVWDRDSDRLYYETPIENNRVLIFEVTIAMDDGRIEAGTSQVALDEDFPNLSGLGGGFDVGDDGQLFVVLKDEVRRPGVLEGGRSNKCVKRKRRCTLSVNY